jgi:hypothetical protein
LKFRKIKDLSATGRWRGFFEFQPFGYSKQSAPTFWNTKTVSEVALMPAPALHLSDRQLKAVKAKDKDYVLSECGRPIHENEY